MAFLREPALFLRDHKKTALHFRDTEWSYADLILASRQMARCFPAEPGQRVAIFGENRPEWAVAFFGNWLHGAINVPIDALSPADDVAYILRDCAPIRLFCTLATQAVAEAALAELPEADRPALVVLEPAMEMVRQSAPSEVDHPTDPDDVVVLIYTSGTTGGPKGVMLTLDNLLTNIEEVVDDVRIYQREDRLLALLPMHHIFSLQGNLLGSMYCGATIHFIEKLASEEILGALQRHRITIMLGVPRLYKLFHQGLLAKMKGNRIALSLLALCRATGGLGLGRVVFRKVQEAFGGHLRYLVSGGAKLDETVARDLRAMGFEILEGYGMTESAPMITFTRPGEVCIGSPGPATRHTELRIVDGEIQARGRHIMKGYWNRPEETAATLKDGWLHTGDMGRVDRKGRLFVLGRSKEIIVLPNGKNINPEEVEDRILALSPLIQEVGVFAQEDGLAAVIRPCKTAVRQAQVVNLRETLRLHVLERFNRHAPTYKRVLQFSLVEDELPRTRLGKLKRFLLPNLASQAETQRPPVPDPDLEAYRLLKAHLEPGLGRPLHPDEHLEYDLGLDSLAKIELDLWLERTFGVVFPEEEPASHGTARELAERVSHLQARGEQEAMDWGDLLRKAQPNPVPSRLGMLRLAQVLFLPLRPFVGMKLTGLENLPEGPCILAPNHESIFDALFLSYALPFPRMAQTHYLATKKHFRKGISARFARNANLLLVDINRDLKGTLLAAAALLRAGRSLVIFPEGTRSRDGQMQPFRRTFALLATALDLPVVPVAIDGAFETFPAHRRLPRPGTITIDILPPIQPGQLDPATLTDQTRQAIVEALAARAAHPQA